MTKLLPTFLCLSVYTYWLRIYRFYTSPSFPGSHAHAVWIESTAEAKANAQQIVLPYNRHGEMILMEAILSAAYLGTIMLAAEWLGRRVDSPAASAVEPSSSSARSSVASRAPLLSALLLSSFGKFLLLLPLIWSAEYTHEEAVVRGIKIFIWTSHVRACAVHQQMTTGKASGLVAMGIAVQFACCALVYTCVDPTILPPQLWF
jgi:hypothetical protein